MPFCFSETQLWRQNRTDRNPLRLSRLSGNCDSQKSRADTHERNMLQHWPIIPKAAAAGHLAGSLPPWLACSPATHKIKNAQVVHVPSTDRCKESAKLYAENPDAARVDLRSCQKGRRTRQACKPTTPLSTGLQQWPHPSEMRQHQPQHTYTLFSTGYKLWNTST